VSIYILCFFAGAFFGMWINNRQFRDLAKLTEDVIDHNEKLINIWNDVMTAGQQKQ